MERQILDDMSYFESNKTVSDITGTTDHEQFYAKWEKIIKSGMEEDLTRLDPMAFKILPKDDIGLLTVARLRRELGSASGQLPCSDVSRQHLAARAKSGTFRQPSGLKEAIGSQHRLLADMKMMLSKPLCL